MFIIDALFSQKFSLHPITKKCIVVMLWRIILKIVLFLLFVEVD